VPDALGDQVLDLGPVEARRIDAHLLEEALDLFDKNGKLIIHHFAGPSWQAKDGSTVVGKLVNSVTVDPTVIPWLLLSAAATTPGRLGQTTFVQRVNTTGGIAPDAATCTPESAGAVQEVPYTADYVFWKKHGSH
jgi:hypothetical protein